MSGPTPPAPPVTHVASPFGATASFFSSFVPVLVFGLPALLILFLVLQALSKRRARGGKTWVIVVHPNGTASRIAVGDVVGPMMLRLGNASQVVFIPNKDHALRLEDGSSLYFAIGIPIASTPGAKMMVAASFDPLLAVDADLAYRAFAAKASTVEVKAALADVVERLWRERGAKVDAEFHEPITDTKLTVTIDVRRLASALLEAASGAVNDLSESSLLMFNTGTTLTKLTQALTRLQQVAGAKWFQVGIIIIIAMIILFALIGGHIL